MWKETILERSSAYPLKGFVGAVIMACVTGLAAQVRIPLPFTPVPLTLQVFAVLFSGVILGRRFGALSQLIYVAVGVLGVPWFTGSILGPTGGYLLGFILAGYISGTKINTYIKMMLAVLAIYLFGAVHFSIVTGSSFMTTLKMAVIPFIGFDIAKALSVSFILRRS